MRRQAIMPTMQAFILPRDFVETESGLIFAVVLYGVEDNRVLCCLRYVRELNTLRKFNTDQGNQLLAERFPEYLYHSAQRDVLLHAVPLCDIAKHHQAQQRLIALWRTGPGDAIEAKALRVAGLLGADSQYGTPLGVTGSLLIGAQHDRSDLDLVYYDRASFLRGREQVRSFITEGIFQELDEAAWRETYERRGCSLTFQQYLWHERRKWNKFMADGTKVDISWVGTQPAWDQQRSHKLHRREITATVTGADEAFDYPARYLLDHPDIPEIISYNPTYSGQAVVGETVRAAGWVEVLSGGRKRLLVGTSREATGEYIRVVPGSQRPDL